MSILFSALCLTQFFSVKVMLMLEVHGLILASIGFLVFGVKYKIVLYFFVCFYQLFKGPSYSTIFSWIDHYITPLCTMLALVRLIRDVCYSLSLRLQGYLYEDVSIRVIFLLTFGEFLRDVFFRICFILCGLGETLQVFSNKKYREQ